MKNIQRTFYWVRGTNIKLFIENDEIYVVKAFGLPFAWILGLLNSMCYFSAYKIEERIDESKLELIKSPLLARSANLRVNDKLASLIPWIGIPLGLIASIIFKTNFESRLILGLVVLFFIALYFIRFVIKWDRDFSRYFSKSKKIYVRPRLSEKEFDGVIWQALILTFLFDGVVVYSFYETFISAQMNYLIGIAMIIGGMMFNFQFSVCNFLMPGTGKLVVRNSFKELIMGGEEEGVGS